MYANYSSMNLILKLYSILTVSETEQNTDSFFFLNFYLFIYLLLFVCAYNAWVISPPSPKPLPYHPLHRRPFPPTSSILGRNYFALISNFVEERV
jgi:hypothetical protein